MSEGHKDLNNKKVLFIRLSSLGDLILTLPTLKAIKDRYPQAHIAWLVQGALQDVLSGNPYLDEIIPVDLLSVTDKYATPKTWLKGGIRFFHNLRKIYCIFQEKGFDVVLEFQALFKSGIFAFLNRRAERYGFKNAKELSHLFLNRPIFLRDKSRHAVENYLQFARYFGCPTEEIEFPIYIPPEDKAYIDRLLLQEGIRPGDFTVFVSATARWQSKFWEKGAFARLGDEMVRRYGAKLIFSGLPSEAGYLQGIREMMQEDAVIVAGRTNIKQFFALMRRSRLFVGVDGGAMHAAVAFGIPVVALFGPSNPRWIGPFGQEKGIVKIDLPCAPCNKRDCPERGCMRGITPEVVLEKVEELVPSL
ncbi:MAG: glycosyltransferase family 9 protein [Deltaproteobacteria bacterium]|nr:glycosyltransferase family 9 protein [Deltaproteobacteria bacterium]